MSTGAELIAVERERQQAEEGWTQEHDCIEHGSGELVYAAAAYLLNGAGIYRGDLMWPWEEKFWKPTPNDRVRELVKAGALIAAEIDRLHALLATPETGSVSDAERAYMQKGEGHP